MHPCEGNILQLLKLPDGTVKVLVEGIKRVKILDFKDNEKFITCDFSHHNDQLPKNENLLPQSENKNKIQSEWLKKADFLTEILPFMKRYANKVIVVKFGGNAMGKKEYVDSFAKDIVLLQQVGMLPVVVHGGGPQIGEMLSKLKIKTEFINGLRITDAATIDVVEMVLSGVTNKSIVTAISNSGAKSVGISGKDGNLMKSKEQVLSAISAVSM